MRIFPYLRLVRAGTLFSPAADVIAGLCLIQAAWSTDAVRLIAASVCLYASGMILNDHADHGIDAKLRPERPLPQGDISPTRALLLGLGVLLAGLCTSPIPIYHGAMAALILGYNYLLKKSPLLGAINMGTLRAMNLLVPAAWIDPSPENQLVFIAAAGYGIYILSVTLLGILEDAPRASRRAVLGLVCVPPLTSSLILYAATPHPWPAAGLGFALSTCLLWHSRSGEWDQRRIRGVMMWLLLGTMLYTGLLALACGRWPEAAVILLMIPPARWIARTISLT